MRYEKLAQLAEHLPFKERVEGSSPSFLTQKSYDNPHRTDISALCALPCIDVGQKHKATALRCIFILLHWLTARLSNSVRQYRRLHPLSALLTKPFPISVESIRFVRHRRLLPHAAEQHSRRFYWIHLSDSSIDQVVDLSINRYSVFNVPCKGTKKPSHSDARTR